MAAFRPFGQLEYQPVQIALPQLQYNQFSAPPQQQSQPSLSPHPTTPQPAFEPPQPHPIVHTPRLPEYPPQDPLQWMLNSLTALLQTQHLELNVKLEELSAQQSALSTKLDTVQQSTNTYQDDIMAINSSLQTITMDVSQLGKDMASRDAMLAERLSALDDAIDPEGRILGVTATQPEALRTPPVSDIQSSDTSLQQQEPEPEHVPVPAQEFQPAISEPEVAPAPATTPKPEGAHIGSSSQAPVLPPDRSSSALSSPELSQSKSSHAMNNTTPPRSKAVSKALQKVKQLDLGVMESPRRSSRTPKKRKPGDLSANNMSTPSKKRKSSTHDVAAKTPAKKFNLKKSTTEKFDWSTIPFREEGHLKDQLIQCETCDIWYHWTCVDIDPRDPMLQDEDTPWACPPCTFESTHGGKGKARTRTSVKHSRCRPDCANDDGPEEKFMIESVVGRFPDYPKDTMQYLVKWDGYPLGQATWTPELEIGNAAPVLIQRFETAAREQEHDLSNWRSLLLLNEASEAGWAWNQAPTS